MNKMTKAKNDFQIEVPIWLWKNYYMVAPNVFEYIKQIFKWITQGFLIFLNGHPHLFFVYFRFFQTILQNKNTSAGFELELSE